MVVSDVDLDSVNVALTSANKSNIPSLSLDPDYVSSLIGVEDPMLITRQINSGLRSYLGVLYNDLPVGTRVMVSCADGTSAMFKKIAATASVMWEMVPNTLKKGGNFIDSSGRVTGAAINNMGLGILAGAQPIFPDYSMVPADWLYWSPLPNGPVIVGDICDVLVGC